MEQPIGDHELIQTIDKMDSLVKNFKFGIQSFGDVNLNSLLTSPKNWSRHMKNYILSDSRYDPQWITCNYLENSVYDILKNYQLVINAETINVIINNLTMYFDDIDYYHLLNCMSVIIVIGNILDISVSAMSTNLAKKLVIRFEFRSKYIYSYAYISNFIVHWRKYNGFYGRHQLLFLY